MKADEFNKNPDEHIERAIGRGRPAFDFDKWKVEHEWEIEVYNSQVGKASKQANQTAMWRIIMNSKLTKLAVAGVIVVAAVIGLSQFGSPFESVTWADVMERMAEDIKSASRIHILLTLKTQGHRAQGDDQTVVEPISLQGEQWFRREPLACKLTLEGEQTVYCFEDTWVCLSHQNKTWFESVPTGQESTRLRDSFDALVSGSFEKYLDVAGYQISNSETVGHDTINGINTTIYDFAGQPLEETTGDDLRIRCWISDLDGKVVRFHKYIGDSKEPVVAITYDLIEYDVVIPEGTFEVKIPDGYTRHLTPEESIRVNTSTDVVTLMEAYDKARKDLPNYRMIVTDEQGTPKHQIARQGNNWRRDLFKYNRLEKDTVRIDPSLTFANLWRQVLELPAKYIESTVMTYGDRAAAGFWPEEGYTDLPESRYTRLPDHSALDRNVRTLEGVAWPEIENVSGPDAEVVVLPSSEKHPGCVGLRVAYIAGINRRNGREPTAVLQIYWIDPSKDYMCVRFEHHQRRTALWENNLTWEPSEPPITSNPNQRDNTVSRHHSRIVEVVKAAQSTEGSWYPTERLIRSYRVNEKGERVESPRSMKTEKFYIDTKGSVDPNWFEWPSELPPPSK